MYETLPEYWKISARLTFRFDALDPGVPDVARRTRAHGLVVVHATERVGGARVGHGARVEALPVDAGGVRGALGVVPALGGQHRHQVRRDCNMRRGDMTNIRGQRGDNFCAHSRSTDFDTL